MRFSTTFRYGARAVVQMAASHPERAVSVREVGQKQGISPKYLEHILQALKAAGVVQAVHGKRGGYVLARSPNSITLKDLYENLTGVLAPSHCVADPEDCPMRDVCPVWDTWIELKDAIAKILERTTVQDLVERANRKTTSPEPMYYL